MTVPEAPPISIRCQTCLETFSASLLAESTRAREPLEQQNAALQREIARLTREVARLTREVEAQRVRAASCPSGASGAGPKTA